MLIAGEASAQASGGIDINGDLTELIYVRAMARGISEDFGGAMVDIKECVRREPKNGKYVAGREKLKRDKREAVKREKALWRRDGERMKELGYTFMGDDETPGVLGWFIREGKNRPVLFVSVFIILFGLFYDHSKMVVWVRHLKEVQRENKVLRMLRDRGVTEEWIEANPWVTGNGGGMGMVRN